jgi:hypothetical protein
MCSTAAMSLAAAAVAAGCGGSEPAAAPAAAETPRFEPGDLGPLVTASPEATGWEWTAKRETPALMSRADIEKYEATYPIQSTLQEAQLEAGLVEARQSSWCDTAKKGSSFATLFETAEGARDALAAEREFAQGWFTDVEHAEIRDAAVADGLGDANWAVKHGSGENGFVEIGWTRGNALLGVYLTCAACPTDIGRAARTWADAIDAKATDAAG